MKNKNEDIDELTNAEKGELIHDSVEGQIDVDASINELEKIGAEVLDGDIDTH